MHITKNIIFVMCIFFMPGKPHTQKNHPVLALHQIQAITHTITQTTYTTLQSLNGATLTLRERGGVGVVGDEQVGFFGGDGACLGGVRRLGNLPTFQQTNLPTFRLFDLLAGVMRWWCCTDSAEGGFWLPAGKRKMRQIQGGGLAALRVVPL